MSKNTNHKNLSENPILPPRKPRPGFKRIVVGWRPVPMQAKHLETPAGSHRCSKCWLKNAQKGHFCRWDIENEGPGRDPNPPMRWAPIYQWVPAGSG